MTLPSPPTFKAGKIVFASDLNAVSAAIPTKITDLSDVAAPTGTNQVLTSLTVADGSYKYGWVTSSTSSPIFTGTLTVCNDSSNYFVVHGQSSGLPPVLQVASKTDPDVSLALQSAGSGAVVVQSNRSIGNLSIYPLLPGDGQGNVVLGATGSSGSIGIQLLAKGTAYSSVSPAPPASDNSNNIATTAWVRTTIDGALSSGGSSGSGTGSGTGVTISSGSWTPVLYLNNSPVTLSQSNGQYWKIGTFVFFNLVVFITSAQAGQDCYVTGPGIGIDPNVTNEVPVTVALNGTPIPQTFFGSVVSNGGSSGVNVVFGNYSNGYQHPVSSNDFVSGMSIQVSGFYPGNS